MGLALKGGSTATIEASWIATSAGMQPVPQLQLRDVAHQEVFDVGLSGLDFINVAPN